MELPFEDDASADKKSFEIKVEGKTSGLIDDTKNFVKVSDKIVDPNDKKNVSWEITINPNKGDVKAKKVEGEDGNEKDVIEYDPALTYSEITFTFKNTKKDAKDDDECKFVYKITYDKINNK